MMDTSFGIRVRTDAALVHEALATRFLSVKRADLRKALDIDHSRLYRAFHHLERQGVLLAEYHGRVSLAERLWSCENG
jgi:DNA-binding IclR family transcriptional regulator